MYSAFSQAVCCAFLAKRYEIKPISDLHPVQTLLGFQPRFESPAISSPARVTGRGRPPTGRSEALVSAVERIGCRSKPGRDGPTATCASSSREIRATIDAVRWSEIEPRRSTSRGPASRPRASCEHGTSTSRAMTSPANIALFVGRTRSKL